jgi:hypothetical protein
VISNSKAGYDSMTCLAWTQTIHSKTCRVEASNKQSVLYVKTLNNWFFNRQMGLQAGLDGCLLCTK